MSKDNCKYLDDEQVKKNLELFNSDKEKFMKEANVLNFDNKSEEIEFRNDLIGANNDNKKEIVDKDETKEISIEEIRKNITKIDVTLMVLFMMFWLLNFILPETGNCSMGFLSGPKCNSNRYIVAFFMSIIPFWLIISSDLCNLSFIKISVSIILFVSSLYVELANPSLIYIFLLILSAYFFIEEVVIKTSIKDLNDN